MNNQQKSINYSLQNYYDLNEQIPLIDHVREMLLPELLEVKPPEYDCNLNKGKQQEQLFVPSTSPGIVYLKMTGILQL